MDSLWRINDAINSFVWGWPTVVLLAVTGVFLTFGLKFFPWRNLGVSLRLIFSKQEKATKESIAPRAALLTALSATVGTGNIAGVATAIYIGGPGAVFYMWLIALFGMATKYTEAVLAVRYRDKNTEGRFVGGPMFYIRKGVGARFPTIAKILAFAFAIFGTIASFGIGNGTQVNSIANVLVDSAGISPYITGAIVALLAGFVIIGGIKRIAEVAERLVPLMIVVYILAGVAVLIVFYAKIPSALFAIVTQAFAPNAAVGGGIGTVILMGFKRGIFSNEAGLGSAPIVHAAANTDNPVQQGTIAMVGVFIDTIVVCTFTALIILVSGVYAPGNGINGSVLTARSFVSAFPHGDLVVSFALPVFAFTTILGWSYYGERCFEYLVKKPKFTLMYRIAYILFIYFAATLPLERVWTLADTSNALMAVPNLIGLLILAPAVFQVTKQLRDKG